MSRPAQAKIARQRKTLRVVMESSGTNFTALAEKVGHHISVVSKAVNHGKYPRVVRKIREVLGV